jgi:hypothetical protein
MADGHDPVKCGYHRKDFGPDEKINHRIEGAYAKQAGGKESEKTQIHHVAKHMQQSKMFLDKHGDVAGKDK